MTITNGSVLDAIGNTPLTPLPRIGGSSCANVATSVHIAENGEINEPFVTIIPD